MKFVAGKRPEWKGKPKASPLDTDVDFLQLRTLILSGRMKPFEEAGMLIYESTDSARLNAKNPARLIRDHLRRILKESNLEPDYDVTCRQTATPGEWGLWVQHLPREMALSKKAVPLAGKELEPIA